MKKNKLTVIQCAVLNELQERQQFALEGQIREAWENNKPCDINFNEANIKDAALEHLYKHGNKQVLEYAKELPFKPISIAEMKRINHENKLHFFDKETMAIFNTKIETKGNLCQNKYFITSTRLNLESPKEYKIREFDHETGRIRTIGKDRSTLKEATEEMNKLLDLTENQKEVLALLAKEPLQMGITADKLKDAWIHGKSYELNPNEKEYIHDVSITSPTLPIKKELLLEMYHEGNREAIRAILEKTKTLEIPLPQRGLSRGR